MRRVIKVGGSLLLRDDLPWSLPRWIDAQADARRSDADENLCIVGGGQIIDAIRNIDRCRPGDPVEIHWMCVDLLETTLELFSNWFPWPCIRTPEQLAATIEHRFAVDQPTIVAVDAFYRRGDPSGGETRLPLDWRTTTDAIAALLAKRVEADELVLLKSCEVDSNATIEQLAQQGIVDQALPMIAGDVQSIRVEQLPEISK